MKTGKDFTGGRGLMKTFALVGLVFLSLHAKAIQVTVSITPLAGIVAPLLDEDDQLDVILKPGQSPHDFQMSPADMKKLAQTDLLITVGTPVDMWIRKPAKSFSLAEVGMHQLVGLKQYPIRKGGVWEKHLHQTAGLHDEEHEHQHEHHDDHENEKEAGLKMDGHLWLSVQNAQMLVRQVSQQLQLLKPQRKAVIEAREQAWISKIQQADAQVMTMLKPLQDVPYLVLHDAFQYFQKRYQLNGVGSIQLNPSVSPSLKRVAELRKKIETGAVQCVFKEPQFPEKRVYSVTQGLKVKVGSLDPLGLDADRGYLLYDQFLLSLANQFVDCLKAQ